MSYRLVTLAEAKRNMRYDVDTTSDDVDLLGIVNDASQIIINYLETLTTDEIWLDDKFSGWTDSSGAPLVDSDGDPLIVDYDLDSNGDPVLDSSGDYVGGRSIIPGSVRRATLLVIAALDKDREGEIDPITQAVKNVLVRYRPPTVA